MNPISLSVVATNKAHSNSTDINIKINCKRASSKLQINVCMHNGDCEYPQHFLFGNKEAAYMFNCEGDLPQSAYSLGAQHAPTNPSHPREQKSQPVPATRTPMGAARKGRFRQRTTCSCFSAFLC